MLPVHRPRITVADGSTCFCRCHRDGERPTPSVNGMAPPGVARLCPVGAVTACDRCRHHHCVALSGRPEVLDRRWWAWWPNAIPEIVLPYAFGAGDGPESV